ncbi:MAG: 16S rRNA processing protein RimM, partial [Clostridia bacterium]|nr:16S rRNA processing protein RimM [Clostridia bacterium]
ILKNVKEIYLEGKDVPSRIVSMRFLNEFLYLKLGTINSREKADLLRGFGVYVDKTLIDIPNNEYIISDIIGSEVLSEDGEHIGKLIDVQNYGATDLFVVEQYKREYLVPFVDDIVKKILPKQKQIIVNKKNYDEAKICE